MNQELPCSQCNYKTGDRSNLFRHIKSIHKGVKYPCTQCDYKATVKNHLLRHIKSTHEGVKFTCVQCDYKATQKGHLLTHIKSRHEREKFSCAQIKLNSHGPRSIDYLIYTSCHGHFIIFWDLLKGDIKVKYKTTRPKFDNLNYTETDKNS